MIYVATNDATGDEMIMRDNVCDYWGRGQEVMFKRLVN